MLVRIVDQRLGVQQRLDRLDLDGVELAASRLVVGARIGALAGGLDRPRLTSELLVIDGGWRRETSAWRGSLSTGRSPIC